MKKKHLVIVCATVILVAILAAVALRKHNASVENGQMLYEEFMAAACYEIKEDGTRALNEYWAEIYLSSMGMDISLKQAIRDINIYLKSIDMPKLAN